MELDRSNRVMNEKLKRLEAKKSIDPTADRSKLTSDFLIEQGNSQIDPKDTKGCRDCPEGMEW